MVLLKRHASRRVNFLCPLGPYAEKTMVKGFTAGLVCDQCERFRWQSLAEVLCASVIHENLNTGKNDA